jgi:hypothetical protein
MRLIATLICALSLTGCAHEYAAYAEATVRAQIANQVSPPVITPPLPWVTPATI